MRRNLPLLLTATVLVSVGSGCWNPNAYKAADEYRFGYAGGFSDSAQKGNQGSAAFTGKKDIPPALLRAHCLHRAAEVCFGKGYDYFMPVSGSKWETTGLKQESRYAGSHTDAYGYKYNRYRVWKSKVPAVSKHISFLAFRGPIPQASGRERYYSVRDILREHHGSMYAMRPLSDPGPATCAHCDKVARQLPAPERCPHCGDDLYATVICPHCSEPTTPDARGKVACTECGKPFRIALCTHCGGRHVLRNYRPFECSFCRRQVDTMPAPRREEFLCPHCAWKMQWPRELHGQYNCPGCARQFTIQRCPGCNSANATRTPTALHCSACGHRVRPSRPKR